MSISLADYMKESFISWTHWTHIKKPQKLSLSPEAKWYGLVCTHAAYGELCPEQIRCIHPTMYLTLNLLGAPYGAPVALRGFICFSIQIFSPSVDGVVLFHEAENVTQPRAWHEAVTPKLSIQNPFGKCYKVAWDGGSHTCCLIHTLGSALGSELSPAGCWGTGWSKPSQSQMEQKLRDGDDQGSPDWPHYRCNQKRGE